MPRHSWLIELGAKLIRMAVCANAAVMNDAKQKNTAKRITMRSLENMIAILIVAAN
jgi:hypothetical protein